MRGGGSNMRKRSSSRGFAQGQHEKTPSGFEAMDQRVKNSVLANIRQEAQNEILGEFQKPQARLGELQRPVTRDERRDLFTDKQEYTNRPGSSYGVNSVTDKLAEQFLSEANMSHDTTAQSKPTQRLPNLNAKPHHLPAMMAPAETKKSLGTIPKSQIKGAFGDKKRNAPIKAQNMLTSAPPIQQQKQGNSKGFEESKGQFSDMMNEKALQEQQNKMMATLTKFKQEQSQMQQQRETGSADADDDLADDLEDYFANQIMADIQGQQEHESEEPDIYSKAMDQITKGLEGIDQRKHSSDNDDDDEAAAYLMEGMQETQGLSLFEQEYDEVITFIGIMCRDKQSADSQELQETAGKIWVLCNDFKMQKQDVQTRCCLETLFKGAQALLDVKHIQSCLRIASTGIHIYFTIFDLLVQQTKGQISISSHINEDALRQFQGLSNIVKVLFKYSKVDDYDKIFILEDRTLEQMHRVVQKLFAGPEYEKLCQLCQKKVKDKVFIGNTDNIWDMVIYLMGAFKNLTMKSEVVNLLMKLDFCQTLHKTLQKCYQKDFSGSNQSVNPDKKPQLVVQVSAVLRYIANQPENYQALIESRTIQDLVACLKEFYGQHKELTFNISRFLSKMSSDFECCDQIARTDPYGALIGILRIYGSEGSLKKKDFMAILNRISFVLGNLTTHFHSSRLAIGEDKEMVNQLLNLSLRLFQKLEPDTSGEQVEELLTKLIRVIANISTEETLFPLLLQNKKAELQEFILLLVRSLQKMNLKDNEEYILNSVSCLTNVLFYDIPQEGSQSEDLVSKEGREQIFRFVVPFVYTSQNDEIQIETVRVLSNLSRHLHMCKTFTKIEKDSEEQANNFVDVLLLLVQNNLRELVYYGIGILINVTLHKECRVAVLSRPFIEKLTCVVRDCNIEDMELAKVAIKALLNLTAETSYWQEAQIKELDSQLLAIGEELDSIMDVASESDMLEIQAYRQLINDLVNNLPEAMHECPKEGCGRKFKTKEECQNHFERRHA